MINHRYKFIFLHIPRTGGTSIEKALCGKDWWQRHPPSKHLTAHVAKKIYAPYWEDYFKFTFVRNPWDRMVSMLRYGKGRTVDNIYEVYRNDKNLIEFTEYFKTFNTIEYDTRFFNDNQFQDFNSFKNSIYYNIVGSEMNFIGKFETLQEDFNQVCDLIGISNSLLPHIQKSHHGHYSEYYSNDTRNLIQNRCQMEIENFSYSFKNIKK